MLFSVFEFRSLELSLRGYESELESLERLLRSFYLPASNYLFVEVFGVDEFYCCSRSPVDLVRTFTSSFECLTPLYMLKVGIECDAAATAFESGL